MRCPGRLAHLLLAAFVIVLAAAPVAAEPADGLDRSSRTVEIWSAAGAGDVMAMDGYGSSDFAFFTGALGLLRFAPFEVGLSLDFGNQQEDKHVLMGPVVGLGLDLVKGLRAEALLEIGAHYVDGVGFWYAFAEDHARGDESVWLLQGGFRIGVSGRIGQAPPILVVGGWVAMFRDLTTRHVTVSYPADSEVEHWEVGGPIGLIGIRLGVEW
jgi:hypothetical protein